MLHNVLGLDPEMVHLQRRLFCSCFQRSLCKGAFVKTNNDFSDAGKKISFAYECQRIYSVLSSCSLHSFVQSNSYFRRVYSIFLTHVFVFRLSPICQISQKKMRRRQNEHKSTVLTAFGGRQVSSLDSLDLPSCTLNLCMLY